MVVGNSKWREVKKPNYLYLRNWTRNKCEPTYTWCEREGILKELSARVVSTHALYYVVLRGRMPPAPAPGLTQSDERCPDLPKSPPKAPGASADRPGFKPTYRVTHVKTWFQPVRWLHVPPTLVRQRASKLQQKMVPDDPLRLPSLAWGALRPLLTVCSLLAFQIIWYTRYRTTPTATRWLLTFLKSVRSRQ